MKNYITYTRVSTTKQSLGLDAQSELINQYIKSHKGVIIHNYSEKESGSNNNRPELLKAIEHCKQTNSILLVAKLDRLTRSVYFLQTIIQSNIHFVIADNPNITPFTLNILSSVAEHELLTIKERINATLSIIKKNIKENGYHITKQGKIINKLGSSYVIKEEDRLKGLEVIKQKKLNNENNIKAHSMITLLNDKGYNYTKIANYLNDKGFKTSKGKQFSHTTVRRILIGFKELSE